MASIHKRHLPEPSDFDSVSKYLKGVVGNGTLLVLGLDMGGYNLISPFSHSLKRNRVYHQHYMLKMKDEFANGGYRRVEGINLDPYDEKKSRIVSPEEVVLDPVSHLLLFDENIELGLSMIGGLIYCLENRDVLGGFEKLYTYVRTDNKGNIAHFAYRREQDPRKIETLDAAFKRIAPKKYRELEKNGLLQLVADGPIDVGNSSQNKDDITDREVQYIVRRLVNV